MTKNEQGKIENLERAEKMMREMITSPCQYEEPALAKSNIEFCLDTINYAIAELRYLSELLDRQEPNA